MLNVATNHAREDAIIDGNRVYKIDQGNGLESLFKVERYGEFTPSATTQEHAEDLVIYRSQVKHFKNWSVWSHIQRSSCQR